MQKTLLIAAILASLTTPALAFTATVVSVHDGDTVSIIQSGKLVHVRLAGIDSPEEKSGRRWNTQPYADEARDALIRMINNQPIDVECTGQESYHRPVCRIYACEDTHQASNETNPTFCPAGTAPFDIQRRMVADGNAWSAIQFEPSRLRDTTLPTLEATAQSEKKGLWALPAIAPWIWRHPNHQ